MAQNNDITKYVLITKGWDAMPVFYHLQQEGCEVLVGQVQDDSELKIDFDKEDPEDKKQRLSQYEGMMKKYPARKLCDALKKVKNKDEYFIFCDQNSLFVYGEELLSAGFTKGLFPTKQDYDLEKEREQAMEFVETNYAKVKIIPYNKVKTVEEAKKIVEEAKTPLVIQSEGDFVSTICPPDDITSNHAEIMGALDKYAKEYSKGEIILKEKLIQPVEITPQIVFYDGKPVFTDIDIETKNLGDGENNGNQVGCGTSLVIATDFEDRINEIAFPPIVYAMAKKRKGIFVWDISLYLTDSGIYFGEFCSNRFGYDSIMAEITMSHGPKAFFTSIQEAQNPLLERFGTSLRVFNLNRSRDQLITIGDDQSTWLYEVKIEKDTMLSVGDCWDLGVMTGCGETINKAIDSVYTNYNALSFKEKYARTKDDFLSDYPTSVINRFITTNHIMFEAPDFVGTEKESETYDKKLSLAFNTIHGDYQNMMEEKDEKHAQEIASIREEINQILNG